MQVIVITNRNNGASRHTLKSHQPHSKSRLHSYLRIRDSFCFQSAPQVVVAVARTIQFYSAQSDVQLNEHTHQQVVAADLYA